MRVASPQSEGQGCRLETREGRGSGFGGGLPSSWESVFLLNRWGAWPPASPPPGWNVICFITVVLHTCGCKCPPRLKRASLLASAWRMPESGRRGRATPAPTTHPLLF